MDFSHTNSLNDSIHLARTANHQTAPSTSKQTSPSPTKSEPHSVPSKRNSTKPTTPALNTLVGKHCHICSFDDCSSPTKTGHLASCPCSHPSACRTRTRDSTDLSLFIYATRDNKIGFLGTEGGKGRGKKKGIGYTSHLPIYTFVICRLPFVGYILCQDPSAVLFFLCACVWIHE